MFDTHIHRKESPYPQSIHVKSEEHRAPTDDSVRLLQEMQDKARDSIVLAMRTESNGFKCLTHVFTDHSRNVMVMRLRFWLNEIEHDKEIELPNSFAAANRTAWLLLIRDEIAKAIAGTIVINTSADGIGICKIAGFNE